MIALSADCLVFEMANGESAPFSSDMISIELMGNTSKWLDQEFVTHAAKAVFHYFKEDLGRQTVTMAEFAEALEKVLDGFRLGDEKPTAAQKPGHVREADLCTLAQESGACCELFFFPRLRDELRRHLQDGPSVLRFRGLRSCVKQLAGSRRWTPRCQTLEEQIVNYLRQCLGAESRLATISLVVL